MSHRTETVKRQKERVAKLIAEGLPRSVIAERTGASEGLIKRVAAELRQAIRPAAGWFGGTPA